MPEAPDFSALKQVYKEMEFTSLLRDLPAEDDSDKRDYGVLATAEEVREWLAARPADAPVAVALDPVNSYVGLSYRIGEGRAVPLALLCELKPLLESPDVPKIIHDSKATLTGLSALNVELNHAAHDVMLYSFLLSADPAGCTPEVLAERLLDRRLNAAAGAGGRDDSRLISNCSSSDRTERTARCL